MWLNIVVHLLIIIGSIVFFFQYFQKFIIMLNVYLILSSILYFLVTVKSFMILPVYLIQNMEATQTQNTNV